MNIDDTIVAVSSGPGAAVRGIVRLSGNRARQIAASLFAPAEAVLGADHSAPSHHVGTIEVGPSRLPAAAWVFCAPRSYTRQDIVELHTLGSPTVLSMVVESCLDAGARRAEAGEFTARAFLSGAMDLSQAHGVAGMIAARSDAELRAAERLLHGDLSRTAQRAKEELADLLSLVEGAMDFADEPIEFISAAELARRLGEVRQSLNRTTAAGLRSERFDRLPTIVLSGLPNAGKSSLLNRLTGSDRALATAVAGTTRDVVTAPLRVGSHDCLFVDVAGHAQAADEIETAAQAAARRAAEEADILIRVVDCLGAHREVGAENAAVLAMNKIDALTVSQREELARRPVEGGVAVCPVSALTGEGCEALLREIERQLTSREKDDREAAPALLAEHRDALVRACEAVERAMALANHNDPDLSGSDLIALELRTAMAALGQLVGQEDTEALLGRIFSRFCVGK